MDWNKDVIGVVVDNENPETDITRDRHTARLIAYNSLGQIAILELKGIDEYHTVREHFETPGGKLEIGETPELAAIREASEELGAKINIIAKLGVVVDISYSLKARTFSHYFEVEVKDLSEPKWTKVEKQILSGVRWFSPEEAVHHYESYPVTGMGKHVHSRDLVVLRKLVSTK